MVEPFWRISEPAGRGCLFRMRTGLGNRVPLAPERHDSSTARRVGGRFRPMVEPFPGCYEGGQKVPPDRPGPPPTAISKHGGRNGGANSRPLSAAAMGPTLPRKPSDQASTNPGRFTTHQAHTLRSPPQDPGTRAATGPTHGVPAPLIRLGAAAAGANATVANIESAPPTARSRR